MSKWKSVLAHSSMFFKIDEWGASFCFGFFGCFTGTVVESIGLANGIFGCCGRLFFAAFVFG